MNFEIIQTRDANILAELNQSVQELHHDLYPDIFKPFDAWAIRAEFERLLEVPQSYAYLALQGRRPIGFFVRICEALFGERVSISEDRAQY